MRNFLSDYAIIITCILSFFSSFVLNRMLTLKSEVKETLKFQLTNVFKPIKISFEYGNLSSRKFTLDDMKKFYDQLHEIISNHYEYIPFELLNFEKELNLAIIREDDKLLKDIGCRMSSYINEKFNSLKSQLNLPSDRISNRWPLMNSTDKFEYIMNKFIVPLFVYFFITVFLYIFYDLLFSFFFKESIQSHISEPIVQILLFLPSFIITLEIYNRNK